MAESLNTILVLGTGALLLGLGVWAGFWWRGAATDPAHLQIRATNRELMSFRKRAHAAMATAIATNAEVINDPSTPGHTRWKLEEVQKCLAKTNESSRDERRRS